MIASEQAGAAISYGLGQGATLVSALWGILIWKEFKGAPKSSDRLNVMMFVLFLIGLGFLPGPDAVQLCVGVRVVWRSFYFGELPCPMSK